MDKPKYQELIKISQKIRLEILQMLATAKSGHPGGSLSSADIFVNLYFSGLVDVNKKNFKSRVRDFIILSAGHYCPALYAVLAYKKFFSKSKLKTLRKFKSNLLGHPKLNSLPGIENSGGSLGHGISIACGLAISLKNIAKKNKKKVYCIMGDGEQNEGQVWEAAMFASHNKLNNLCVIIDVNKIQIDGFTKDVLNSEPLDKKYRAFNFMVIKIDGNDHRKLYKAIKKFKNYKGNKPTVILANTIAGKGLRSIENKVRAHGQPITNNDIDEYLKYNKIKKS
jgi:transketolase